MKTYCYQCGTAVQYGGTKPNFCPKCGCALNTTKATKLGSESPVSGLELELEPEIEIPLIDALEVDIEVSAGQQITLGEIAGTSEGNASSAHDDFKAPKSKKMSKKKFLDEFKKEAVETRQRPK